VEKKILLIDDDGVINLVHKKIIEKHFDFRTIIFTDAVAALEQLKQWLIGKAQLLPEIIFLDIEMPNMSGWEFLDELHALPSHHLQRCKVVILSSSIDYDDIEKSKSYRAVVDFISKPLTVDRLRTLI
jgi:CheY-like chemotaxis protein